MGTAFDTVNECAPILEVAKHFGLPVNRSGFVLCPIHGEKSPSLKLYQDTNTFHCFGCGAGTSVVDFVAAVAGISPLEAARQLDTMFALRLFMDEPLTVADRKKIAREKEQRQRERGKIAAFEEWERQAFRIWVEYCCMLERYQREYAPKSMDEAFDPRFVQALHQLDYADYIFYGTFVCGSFADKAHFYQSHREEVDKIAQYIGQIGHTG